MGKVKKIGIGIGIAVGAFFLIGIAAVSIDTQQESPNPKTHELSPAEIKAQALSGVTYDNLMRNNENYVGEIVHYKGLVKQVDKIYGDKYFLRVGVAGRSSDIIFVDDVIYVNYAGPRILKGDTVELWGNVKGLTTYTIVLGNSVTIPEVDALILDIVQKCSENIFGCS